MIFNLNLGYGGTHNYYDFFYRSVFYNEQSANISNYQHSSSNRTLFFSHFSIFNQISHIKAGGLQHGISWGALQDFYDSNHLERYASSYTFPNCNYIGSGAFQNYNRHSCDYLILSFPKCSIIFNHAFDNQVLEKIYLYGSSQCLLYHSNAIGIEHFSSQLEPNSCHIFVPSSMVSIYQSATNWAYHSNIITGR